jgi:ribonuclease P protein component
MPYRYRKSERLKKNTEFVSTMKGKRLSVDGLSLFYAPNDTGRFRVGISISKKLVTSAVKRNRLKRQLRDCIGRVLKSHTLGYDLVFVARRGLSDIGFERILKTVEAALRKSSLRIRKPEGAEQ